MTDQQKDQKEELVTWLPVDGSITINDDVASAPKTAAIAEANKKYLRNGEQKGAIEKLKLADINIDFVLVALPLDETIAKVHQAGPAGSTTTNITRRARSSNKCRTACAQM